MTKIELVFVPTPGIGHLLSMVEFAKLVVRTNPNISITVLLFHIARSIESTKLHSYIESQSRELDPDQIEFVTLPPLSNPPDPSKPAFIMTSIKLQNPLVEKAIQDRQSKPLAFVLDLMNVSMIDIANELHIPSYVYFTAGAGFLQTMFHFQEVADEHGIDSVTGLMDNPDSELDLPGFTNPVPVNVLPWVYFDMKSGWGPSAMYDLARRFQDAKGIFVNSFTELESSTFQILQNNENLPTIYPVGPILSLGNRGESKPSNDDILSPNVDEESVISWLDGQPKSSVVFLCFGSRGSFNAKQVKEIADGLDRSGYRFLWSLRKPVQVANLVAISPSEQIIFEDALPNGFMDRTAHKGKIIPWAPQVAVLAHEAVGGFVSHCGWNSTLESIWFGVPLATWPLFAEQQLNAFTLVKELGLAVEIKLDYRWNSKKQEANYLVKVHEVEDGVRRLMSVDEEMRGRLQKMGELSRNVLKINVSSRDSVNSFIAELTQNVI